MLMLKSGSPPTERWTVLCGRAWVSGDHIGDVRTLTSAPVFHTNATARILPISNNALLLFAMGAISAAKNSAQGKVIHFM
jgi:hypothetical protein